MNKIAILDFLDFGLCCPSHTFWSTGTQKFSPKIQQSIAFPQKNSISLAKAAQDIFQQLEESIAQIINSKDCQSFAMSGGADSRLIFSILYKNHPNFLKEKKIYSRVHPSLGAEQDRDYLIAKEVCSKFNVKLEKEVATQHAQTYLIPLGDSKTKCLSGLWGGELLGGTLMEHKLFSFENCINTQRESQLRDFIIKSTNHSTLNEHYEFSTFAHLLHESQHTAFYNALTWFYPQKANAVTRTPFLNEDFLNKIFSLPFELIANYRLYQTILEQHCSDFLFSPINNNSIPTSSKITHPKLGIEPKSLSPRLALPSTSQINKQQIFDFIDTHKDKTYYLHLRNILPYIDEHT